MGVDPSTEFSPTYPDSLHLSSQLRIEDVDASYRPSPKLGRLGVAATAAFAWDVLRTGVDRFRAQFELPIYSKIHAAQVQVLEKVMRIS
jgi:hypothetical protein